jgi:hypothetical protein
MEFIKIENKNTWILNSIPQHFPGTKKYIDFWRTEKQKCIEGLWGPDFDGYRYMPPNIYFYCNFVIITDTDEDQNVMIEVKPELRDLEWELSYAWMEARGFSGFEFDEYYSCDLKLKKYLESDIKTGLNIHSSWLKGDGTLKTFKPAREVLRQLHSQPLGRPLYRNNAKNIMVLGCLSENTEVKMFDGSTKLASNIRINDLLMGPDSTSREVKDLIQGNAMMYEISTRYGDTFKCTESHLLHLLKSKQIKDGNKTKVIWEPINISVGQFLDIPEEKRKANYQAVKSDCINYKEKNLELDPYFIGLWLGDGFKREKLICVNQEKDKEILDWLIDYCKNDPKLSYTISISKNGYSKGYTTRFRLIHSDMLYKNNYWSNTFLNKKHIPSEYMLSSEEQRLNLLAGYIDSDGCYEKQRYTITSIDNDLIKQTQELARSLGFRASIHSSKDKNKLKHNLRITGNITKIPCKLSYKKATQDSQQKKGSNKNDIDIKFVGIEPFYGFEVDKDHLFLLKDYTITHNSRGGGKSFFTAGAIILHELIFDGKKYYDTKNPEGGIKTKTSVFVGAAQSTYSSDILEKVSSAMNALAINPNLGIYGNPTNPIESNYTPNPFYKNMRGSLQPNNKKSPWVHKYEKKVRGKWIDGFGTNAKLFHGIYSAENPQAAAGTRPSVLVIEEVGLLENLITPHQSNEAAQTIGSKRIGSAIYIGTAGNMEKIRESREVFTDPDSYSMLEYNDDWEHSGKIGFFLPAYYTNKDFKDENGNTDVEKARQYYLDRREKARKASNPKVYEGELMNYPIVPSEMFIGRTGNILPVAELKEVEKKLIKNNIYQRIGTPIDIFYDSTQPHGVDYKVIPDKRPLFEYPIPKNADIEGCITMYEAPIYVNGIVPNDLYNLVGYDPYVSENLDEGESLGSVYVMKNPKYLSHGYGGNEIVAGYVGKHAYGTNAYNENVEKLLMLYGNPYRGLWFEADRGKHVKSFFENKYKLHLLCLRPQKEMNTSVVAKKVANYGWITGSKINKIQLIDMLADWLKEETEINGIKKRNLERIPDIGLIRELQAFQLEKGNYDRVMALVGCVLGLRETENLYKQSTIEKHNPLSILVANKYFKTHKDVKKYRTKV